MCWPPLLTRQDQRQWPPKALEAVPGGTCVRDSVSWMLLKAEPIGLAWEGLKLPKKADNLLPPEVLKRFNICSLVFKWQLSTLAHSVVQGDPVIPGYNASRTGSGGSELKAIALIFLPVIYPHLAK